LVNPQPVQQAVLPPLETNLPATFRSRGVAAPFTTPLLAGARLREAKHSGVELIVPNPSGGRGVYIVQWPGVRALCTPTVHDAVLFNAIARLPRIEPGTIREAALTATLAGYAGRDALAAAQVVRAADQANRLLTDFLILANLVEQIDPTGRRMVRLTDRTTDFDQRAGVVLRRIADPNGCTAADLTLGIAALGEAFAPIGVTPDDQNARIPRLIARLRQTQTQLSGWLVDNPDGVVEDLARTVNTALRLVATTAETMLSGTRAVLADPVSLLKRWVARSREPAELPVRCDWVLDGWERICLLWKTADSLASRRAILLEMAHLIPILPNEVHDWIDSSLPGLAGEEAAPVVSGHDAWRSGGALLGLIQRNEALRALSW
jgi:hypothetical protein